MANLIWDDSELKAALAELETKIPNNVEECVNNVCLAIEDEAKMLCPKESGTLRRSIQTEVKTSGTTCEGKVGTCEDYAIYVHQGTGIYARNGDGRQDVPWVYYSDKLGHCVSTKGIKPTPFLEDALEHKRGEVIDYFREVLK